jgi:hypothetical protein
MLSRPGANIGTKLDPIRKYLDGAQEVSYSYVTLLKSLPLEA